MRQSRMSGSVGGEGNFPREPDYIIRGKEGQCISRKLAEIDDYLALMPSTSTSMPTLSGIIFNDVPSVEKLIGL